MFTKAHECSSPVKQFCWRAKVIDVLFLMFSQHSAHNSAQSSRHVDIQENTITWPFWWLSCSLPLFQSSFLFPSLSLLHVHIHKRMLYAPARRECLTCRGGQKGRGIRRGDKSCDCPHKRWEWERDSRKDEGREGRSTGDGFNIRGRKLWLEMMWVPVQNTLLLSPPSPTHPPAVSLSSLLFLSASMRLLPLTPFCSTLLFMLSL